MYIVDESMCNMYLYNIWTPSGIGISIIIVIIVMHLRTCI